MLLLLLLLLLLFLLRGYRCRGVGGVRQPSVGGRNLDFFFVYFFKTLMGTHTHMQFGLFVTAQGQFLLAELPPVESYLQAHLQLHNTLTNDTFPDDPVTIPPGQLTGCGLGGTIVPTRHIGGGRAHMYMYEKARAHASLSVRLKEEGGDFFAWGRRRRRTCDIL